jgi:hypothetical protein
MFGLHLTRVKHGLNTHHPDQDIGQISRRVQTEQSLSRWPTLEGFGLPTTQDKLGLKEQVLGIVTGALLQQALMDQLLSRLGIMEIFLCHMIQVLLGISTTFLPTTVGGEHWLQALTAQGSMGLSGVADYGNPKTLGQLGPRTLSFQIRLGIRLQ